MNNRVQARSRMSVMAEQRRAATPRTVEGRRARFAFELRRVAGEMEKDGEGGRPEMSTAPSGVPAGPQPPA